ncbi:MAG: transglycosylase domain-containing protein [Actinomycetes bacterium]
MSPRGGGGGRRRAASSRSSRGGSYGAAGRSRGRARGRTNVSKPWWYPTWKKILGLAGAGFLGGVILFGVAYAMIPIPETGAEFKAQSTVVRWADGSEIGRIGTVNRQQVQISRVPDHVQKAMLSAENRTFYSDSGISPIGMARALYNNLRGGTTQGGSTITQQMVKYTRLSSFEQTYTRKFKEAIIAIKVDREMTKDAILQEYLNAIYFGRGAYGIQAASDVYFGKDVSQLTPSEGALLASLVKSPSTFDPVEARDRVEARWRYVLDGMVEEGWLSRAKADAAKYPKVQGELGEGRYAGTKGYLLAAAKQELIDSKRFTEDDFNRNGLDVTTTFRKKAVNSANRAVAQNMPEDAKKKDVFAGMAAVRPGTGEVVAIYGGDDYINEPFNAATQARMQAGSTFKPFTLTAALQEGIGLKSRFNGDAPKTFPEYGRPVDNYGDDDEDDYGMVNLIKATESSINTVYVKLGIEAGDDQDYENIVDVARDAGIPKSVGIGADPSIPLGTASPRVLDMAGAYATFAAQGKQADPYMVKKVQSPEGGLLYEHEDTSEQVFDEDVMADVSYALQKVVENGSGAVAQAIGRPSAGKTGTSQDFRSALYAGYTPQLSATVAFYRDGQKPLRGIGRYPAGEGMAGGSYPAEIWTDFMQGALRGTPVEPFPDPEFVGKTMNPKPTPTPTPTPTTPTPTITPTPTPTLPPEPTPTEPDPGGPIFGDPDPTPTDPESTPTEDDGGWPLGQDENNGNGKPSPEP